MYNRIALIKLCCPGDLLFTTPAIRAIKNSFPKSELHFFAGGYSRFVPEHIPHISQTITLDPPFERNGNFKGLRAMAAGVALLSKRGFDLAISFHRSRSIASMARLARIKNVLGFETSKPPATIAASFDSHAHEVRRYLTMVAVVGASPCGEGLEYHTTQAEDEEADLLLGVVGIKRPFAIIAPGGGENPGTRMHTKRWPAVRFRGVVSYLREQKGLLTVAVGSPNEFGLAESIAADINLAGKTSFPILAAVAKRAEIFIGNDSGPLYLASAVGVRTVGIYGPSSPDLVAPLATNHTSVINRVQCHPCYHPDKLTRGNISCPIGSWACMLTLGPDQVVRAIDGLLKSELTQKSIIENTI